MVNIIIPMAGLGSRFVKAGFTTPKPFIDVGGQPMIVRVLENLAYNNARYILILREEHIKKEKTIIGEIKEKFNVVILPIGRVTEGATCTVLHAREYINNDIPMIIANSDQIIDINFSDFVDDCLKRKLDGSIMTFVDLYNDPKWSFAKVDKNELVKKVAEKNPISKYATVGIYMFKAGNIFVDSAIDMIVSNDRINNEFYVAPIYNYSIRNNYKIGIYNIKFSCMHGLGTPEDLAKYTEKLDLN